MRHLVKCATLLSIALLTSACASGADVRNLAKRTASLAANYSMSIKQFAEYQVDMAAQDAARIDFLKTEAREAAGNADLLESAWTLGNKKDELARYRAASTVTAASIIATMQPVAAAAPDKAEAVKLDDAIKTLNEIAVAPSRLDRLRFLGGYIGSVQKQLKELQEKAQKDAADAATKADDVASKTKSEADTAKNGA